METETLPKGEANQPLPEVQSFEAIVASSKAKLAQEAEAQVKRSRGRPPGTGKHQRAAAESSAGAGAEKKSAGDSSVNAGGENPSAESRASMHDLAEELKPLIQETVKVPFAIASYRYDCPSLEITDDDAKVPSRYLARYIELSFPELERQGPKAFNLSAFFLSLVVVVLKKIPLLMARKNPPPAEENSEPIEENSPPPASVMLPVFNSMPLNTDGRAGNRTGF